MLHNKILIKAKRENSSNLFFPGTRKKVVFGYDERTFIKELSDTEIIALQNTAMENSSVKSFSSGQTLCTNDTTGNRILNQSDVDDLVDWYLANPDGYTLKYDLNKNGIVYVKDYNILLNASNYMNPNSLGNLYIHGPYIAFNLSGHHFRLHQINADATDLYNYATYYSNIHENMYKSGTYVCLGFALDLMKRAYKDIGSGYIGKAGGPGHAYNICYYGGLGGYQELSNWIVIEPQNNSAWFANEDHGNCYKTTSIKYPLVKMSGDGNNASLGMALFEVNFNTGTVSAPYYQTNGFGGRNYETWPSSFNYLYNGFTQ